MLLGFKKQFVPRILDGTKIHTIRENNLNRWMPGRIIHMATGIRTKNYHQFALSTCIKVVPLIIYPDTKDVIIFWHNCKPRFLSNTEIKILSLNDGFDNVEDFWLWFNELFNGSVIYWDTNNVKNTS